MSEPTSILNRAAAFDGQTIAIADRGLIGQITLRGDLSSKALKAAVRAAVGVEIPAPLRANHNGGEGAVWMSPDELLLLTSYDEAEIATALMTQTLAKTHHMAVNVSDARAVIALTGPGVAEVLAKGAPLDLSDAAFPVGTARRTHIGGIAVGCWRKAEDDWEIVCFRSFARHLFDWLVESSKVGSEVGAL
jgi:sarcosine oxidase subunit gamma